MNKSDSIGKLAEALAKAQGAMKPAKMDATNPFLKNRYADLGSVIEAVKTPMAENGLSYTQHPSIVAESVTVSTMLMHSSGEWIESDITLPLGEEKGLSLAQSMGKVVTYMRRYSLSAIMGVYADEDNDGNKPAAAAKQQQPAPSPKPEPAPVQQPAPDAGNGDKPKRPYAPEVIRDGLKYKAEHKFADYATTKEQRGLTVGMLNKCFIGEEKGDDIRHAVLNYLTGKTSINDVSDAYVQALLDWLKPTKDSGGDYTPDFMAQREAGSLWTASLEAAGQQSLL